MSQLNQSLLLGFHLESLGWVLGVTGVGQVCEERPQQLMAGCERRVAVSQHKMGRKAVMG